MIHAPSTDCICGTREYPHFDPRCPEHGKLTADGQYDQRQAEAVRKVCVGCGEAFYFTHHQAERCGWCRKDTA